MKCLKVVKFHFIINDIVFLKFLQKKTLKLGTTTASYYGPNYYEASLIIAKKAAQYGQRALVGKVNRNLPLYQGNSYIETTEESFENTKKFIQDVKKIGVSLKFYH